MLGSGCVHKFSFINNIEGLIKQRSGNLQTLLAKVQEIQKINNAFRPILEPHLQDYVYVVNKVADRLVVMAANNAVAMQLRFQTPDILRKLKQSSALNKICYLHVKIAPSLAGSAVPSRHEHTLQKMPLLSLNAAQAVMDIAKSLDDPKLGEIMARIASHCKEET